MIRLLLVACIAMILAQSCTLKSEEKSKLVGKWIVDSQQRYFEKKGKIVDLGELEKVNKEDAYVYNFKSGTLVTITNINEEFAWDFKLIQKDSVLTLINIHGDAEDDELIYNNKEGKLTLLRKQEDADPEDDTSSILVCDLMNLKKI